MTKVSIIIPVYNGEKYLRQCLDSALSQSFDDIEVICIDDGSTDTSPDILNEYHDTRVRIYSQPNQGAGASRNNGLKYAKGEYVYFMDCDDYLEENALEEVYNIAVENKTDFVMFKIKNFNDKTGEIIDDDYYSMPYLKEAVGDEAFNYDDISKMALDLCVCPPGNLFNREFIKGIEFPEGLLFEDNVFFTHALFKAERIIFYDEFLYNRRKHQDSITTSTSVKSMDTIDITDMLLDLCDEYNHNNHRGELYYRIFHNIYQIFKNAEKTQKNELFDKIKHDYLKYHDKWERDEYFNNELNPKYKHIYNCALKSRNARKFETCVENYAKESKLTRLKDKLL